jgi:hypothetical protein
MDRDLLPAGEAAVAHVCTVDPTTGDDSLVGTFRDRLKTSVPFDVVIVIIIDFDFDTLDDVR